MPFDENGNWVPQDPADSFNGPERSYGMGNSGWGGMSLMDLLSPFTDPGSLNEENPSTLQGPESPPYDQTVPTEEAPPEPSGGSAPPAGGGSVNPWETLLGGAEFYPEVSPEARAAALNAARHALGATLIAAGLAPNARGRAQVMAGLVDNPRQAYRGTLAFADKRQSEAENDQWRRERQAHAREQWANEDWKEKIAKDAFEHSHESAPAEVQQNVKILEDSLQKAVAEKRMTAQEADVQRANFGAISRKYLDDPTNTTLFSQMYTVMGKVADVAGTREAIEAKVADDMYELMKKANLTQDQAMKVYHDAAILPGMEAQLRLRVTRLQAQEKEAEVAGQMALTAAGGVMELPGGVGRVIQLPDGRQVFVANRDEGQTTDPASARKFFNDASVQEIVTDPGKSFSPEAATDLANNLGYKLNVDIIYNPTSGGWMLSPEKQKSIQDDYKSSYQEFNSNPKGIPGRGAATGTKPPLTMAQIRATAAQRNVTVGEAMQNAIEHGYTITP